MTPARLQTTEEIFHAALDQEPDQISTFLDRACGGDELLRRNVEALLASNQQAVSFIETPAASFATRIIQNGQADLLVDQTIGHYKISESIGTGGMGEVYLATDITAGRKAALKLLPLCFTGDAERLKRFQQEARTVVGLNHPNILTVYEIGQDHSIHYIASELIEGETLRERLKRGPMQLSEAVDIAIQVASAVAAAHRAGIVHRDIKPENIMIRPDGYVKVLDFGIAKLAEEELPATMPRDEALLLVETNLGSVLGTVRYMSPEQACGGQVGKSTDVWSLGVVLYEMVTGQLPFTGETPARSATALQAGPKEVMNSILETEPPPLTTYIRQASAELQQIISKTLRKVREERYQNAHELLQRLKNLRHKLEVEAELQPSTATPSWLHWTRPPVAVVLVLVAAAMALALPFYRNRNLTTTNPPPEKSIAVLPFENLSSDKENAYFADGIQDELLTDLARIADLKVIGRTSVMQYKSGVARNLRKIGRELGVAHLVEGSVERSGNRVRVNAQLVDARTDRRLWGQTYDRDLADVFAIQNEVAKTIAEQLQAKLSPAEENAIAQTPTTDLTAFDLYTRAKNLFLGATISNNGKRDLLDAADLLNQAVSRDPAYFQAYCQLVWTHDLLYSLGHDHSPARLALAETAIEAAFHLRPDAGEAHLARAENLYDGYLDYDDSLTELKVARQSLPNDPRVFELKGYIERRQGKLEEALHSLERSVDLDPHNILMIQQIAATYHYLRRYAEENSMYNRAQAIEPNDLGTKVGRARVPLDWKADPRPMHELIDSVRATEPGAIKRIADSWTVCALAERDAAGARQAVIAAGENTPLNQNAVHFSGSFVDGLVARMTGDNAKARSAFLAARAEQEQSVRLQPNYAPPLCVLGVIDAALGRKEEALREGRHAVELLPVEKDLANGALMLEYLAIIAAWLGDKDLACEELATVIRYPGFLSYGELKLLPYWDPLRGDPRFEKILEESKNPVTLPTSLPPETSIAVLPFENLSKDEENAFFAGGVQDEILTDLAKIADLKVISRTSVMKYKTDLERNLREIAKTLGVSYVVEGSVQRAGGRVRVNVQLIDARNDTHLWAEHYDRDVADIFSIQSEIAERIADQLRAKLSTEEKAAIAERPTANAVAYAYYTKAREMDLSVNWEGDEKSLNQKVELLEKATQRDPNFALAYCALAKTQVDLSNVTEDPERLELAKKAAEAALRLRPDLGEAHLELARYYFESGVFSKDYTQARDELAIVSAKLPNNAEALMIEAMIGRHENRCGRLTAQAPKGERARSTQQ